MSIVNVPLAIDAVTFLRMGSFSVSHPKLALSMVIASEPDCCRKGFTGCLDSISMSPSSELPASDPSVELGWLFFVSEESNLAVRLDSTVSMLRNSSMRVKEPAEAANCIKAMTNVNSGSVPRAKIDKDV